MQLKTVGAVLQPNEHLQGLPLSDLEPLPLAILAGLSPTKQETKK